jgi:hypothetical protein
MPACPFNTRASIIAPASPILLSARRSKIFGVESLKKDFGNN